MFYVSDIKNTRPETCRTALQEQVYDTLDRLRIPYERVDTDEAVTMADCTVINEKLDMKMVKTLFLCNRQKSSFFLFITRGDKPFRTKEFSQSLGVSRVSFAPAELMNKMLQTKAGAATVFSALLDPDKKIAVIFDSDILQETWYGCSDGTTTGHLKIKTADILQVFLPFTRHEAAVIAV